jgi:intracellular sulfur oxidation DsrE/DsrF family protein
MSTEHEVSDELLNAFADNELDAEEKAHLLNLMTADPELKARVCRHWQLKEMVRGAFPLPSSAALPRRRFTGGSVRGLALAASLLLTLGVTLGWVARGGDAGQPQPSLALNAAQVGAGRVILHLGSSDPDRIKAALDEAEHLARGHDLSGRPVQVELLVNGDGLDLVRADVSAFADRIASMHATHHNLKFIACNNTIELLRAQGVNVDLLPDITVAPSALGEVMTRLRQGWTYIQV